MSFMQIYKKLDNLLRDMNGVGVTGYIDDMERRHNGEYVVTGWKDDYYKLKHYRYIRNQIAHETAATEENMCNSTDELWVKNFYTRVFNQTDPLAQYRKLTHPKKTTPAKSTKTVYSKAPAARYSNFENENKNGSPRLAITIFIVIMIVALLAAIIFQDYFKTY